MLERLFTSRLQSRNSALNVNIMWFSDKCPFVTTVCTTDGRPIHLLYILIFNHIREEVIFQYLKCSNRLSADGEVYLYVNWFEFVSNNKIISKRMFQLLFCIITTWICYSLLKYDWFLKYKWIIYTTNIKW